MWRTPGYRQACFGGTGYGNCSFIVRVDANANVAESNEGNTFSATCPGG